MAREVRFYFTNCVTYRTFTLAIAIDVVNREVLAVSVRLVGLLTAFPPWGVWDDDRKHFVQCYRACYFGVFTVDKKSSSCRDSVDCHFVIDQSEITS